MQVRAPGSLSFQLDGGDPSQVEAAVEAALVSYFAASGAMSDFTRSVATSATVGGRRLQQQLQWSVSWDVFVYEQQRDSVTAAVLDLRSNPSSQASFADLLLAECLEQ